MTAVDLFSGAGGKPVQDGTSCYNQVSEKAPSRCFNNRGHDTRHRRSDVSTTVSPSDSIRMCVVPGCDRPRDARGHCSAHLARLRRTGSAKAHIPIASPDVRSQEDRFWEKVDKRGPYDCWLWAAALTSTGYGALRPAGQRHGPVVKAHRYSAELAGMDITAGDVLHSCDQPRCVNPAHLRIGTHAENMRDMSRRGRAGTPGKRMNESDVRRARKLRQEGWTYQAIADAIGRGIHYTTIGRVIRGESWRRVK